MIFRMMTFGLYIYYTTYKNGEIGEFCDDSTSIISPY